MSLVSSAICEVFCSETWEDVDVSVFLGIICYKHDYICLHVNIFSLMVSIERFQAEHGGAFQNCLMSTLLKIMHSGMPFG